MCVCVCCDFISSRAFSACTVYYSLTHTAVVPRLFRISADLSRAAPPSLYFIQLCCVLCRRSFNVVNSSLLVCSSLLSAFFLQQNSVIKLSFSRPPLRQLAKFAALLRRRFGECGCCINPPPVLNSYMIAQLRTHYYYCATHTYIQTKPHGCFHA